MVGLPAYLLGKQGVRDAMLLPGILNLEATSFIQPFKCKVLSKNHR
jgi:hypothetical protein